MIKQSLYIICGLVLCTASPASAEKRSACSDASPITFGILPFISVEQLVARFSPIADYLSKRLDANVRLETAPDFAEFARRTNIDQRYDILFTAPHFYPGAHDKAGYRLIAGVDSPGMWAVIVVPSNSQIRSLDDLVGKRLATLPPAGLATLLVRKHLSDAGINPDTDIEMVNTPSHDASLLSSYHGITDASALMQPPYEASNPKLKNSMRIIAETESTPHIPISVSPRLNDECMSAIAELLLNMDTTKEGKHILSQQAFSGFKQTSTKDYDKIRQILSQ